MRLDFLYDRRRQSRSRKERSDSFMSVARGLATVGRRYAFLTTLAKALSELDESQSSQPSDAVTPDVAFCSDRPAGLLP